MLHKFLKIFLSLSLLFICSITLKPNIGTKAQASSTAIINTSILNVREGPGLSYNIKSKIKQGEQYKILERKNDWLKLEITKNSSGWVASWLIKESNSESIAANDTSKTVKSVKSTVDGLRLRTGPGTSFQIMGSLNKGQVAQYIDKNESWTKVKYNNQIGWVSSPFLTTIQGSNNKPDVTNKQKSGKVNTSVLNVRSTPNLQGSIIGKLTKGSTVSIKNERENWLEITFNKGNAWVHRDYINVDTTNEDQDEQEEEQHETQPDQNIQDGIKKATVTASSLNVRDSGSLSGKIIGKLKIGEEVTINKEINDWSQITLTNGKKGWVASWYLEVQELHAPDKNEQKATTVKVLYNGTNIRTAPSSTAPVTARANEGDVFNISATEGDWYKIVLSDKTTGYIAGWIVEVNGNTSVVQKPGVNQYLKNKTIVIDPGHGGRDGGTVGVNGTIEKNVTLRTARLVFDKLHAAGANVVLTRNSDLYVSLRSRVSTSHYRNADAFISVHYDSTTDRSARGITSYYYKNIDTALASTMQSELIKNTNFKDRKHRKGNYQVLRENKNPSALLELGFLSNPTEEYSVNTNSFQENVSNGIYYGLAQYFKGR
ncbi:SH3 domain-containing protein [Ferdinandcohnia quinoae]|uniref:SH3 domain-containing protein n=1 Tax=Fredinandcohnia quinoae TaxID=2918902 RepID=A0AAW5EER2_9BACI|nr:SH3 domain-containing protein [Fredinandcohnia sp. SECRCQ15]MCH1627663.1 SH3 domain-containing protein [Fredinandcohnia sp. SECRCQ15]